MIHIGNIFSQFANVVRIFHPPLLMVPPTGKLLRMGSKRFICCNWWEKFVFLGSVSFRGNWRIVLHLLLRGHKLIYIKEVNKQWKLPLFGSFLGAYFILHMHISDKILADFFSIYLFIHIHILWMSFWQESLCGNCGKML